MAPTRKASRTNTAKPKIASSIDLGSAITSLVNDKMKDLLGETSTNGPRGKRLSSERDEEGESDGDEPPPLKLSKPATSSQATPDYATQVVILVGVDDGVKKHPTRLSRAFAEAKPNVELRPDGLRLTASGDVLVKPKNPKDCNSLLKENAFLPPCALGNEVKARVPKAQQITYQVIIKNVDVEVTQEEMDEILTRQSLPYKSVKRIHSRQRDAPTKMFRLILKEEETKKKLLRDGINLDHSHYKCEKALEDTKSFPKILQCFKCQAIGDHFAGSCPKEQRCVLCAGPHRKAECTATKETFKCANCSGAHAAWSQECPRIREAVDMKKTPTLAQVASATVTPAMLEQALQEVKESIVLLVAEVVARSICELVHDLLNKNVSKLGLPLKVANISNNAVYAANKLKFGPAKVLLEKNSVKDKIVGKCFANNAESEPQSQKEAPAKT